MILAQGSGGPPFAPADHCVHDLFAAQARRTPDAVAFEHDGQTLSYSELAQRAAALTGRLAAHGVSTRATSSPSRRSARSTWSPRSWPCSSPAPPTCRSTRPTPRTGSRSCCPTAGRGCCWCRRACSRSFPGQRGSAGAWRRRGGCGAGGRGSREPGRSGVHPLHLRVHGSAQGRGHAASTPW